MKKYDLKLKQKSKQNKINKNILFIRKLNLSE